MSKIFEALMKAEATPKRDQAPKLDQTPKLDQARKAEQARKADKRSVSFVPLDLLRHARPPIKIDFDLDPLLEEQYQKLRRRLAPKAEQPGVKVIMVAATTHGEGATTTSAILASTLARSGHAKILLVDANLRTPALDGVFNDNQSPEGLTDVIVSDKPVDSAIYQTNFANLFLLPVGRPHSSPSYLFDGDPILNLLTTLKERFDFIIFDSAPLDGYSESFFLASKVDGVILVVESERTSKQVVKKIKKELEWGGPINLLGIVLNKKKNYVPATLDRFI